LSNLVSHVNYFSTQCLARLHAPVPGASPRVLHPERDHPNFSLLSSDIDGATPASSTFSSARVVDPNNPQYKLPTCEPVVVDEPRFLRDTLAGPDPS
jgi:hypothetical protein